MASEASPETVLSPGMIVSISVEPGSETISSKESLSAPRYVDLEYAQYGSDNLTGPPFGSPKPDDTDEMFSEFYLRLLRLPMVHQLSLE